MKSTPSNGKGFDQRGDIINQHPLPKGFARRDEPRVLGAAFLVELVVGQGFEMEGDRAIEGMVRYRPLLRRRGRSHERALEVGDPRQLSDLALERGAILRGKILPQPEINIMNEHGMVCYEINMVPDKV